jgi:predicted nucleotidyltransferase
MLQPDIRKRVDEFAVKLNALYGEGLVSVILYGSAASGEYVARRSNINLLVILKDASLRNLAKASPIINSFRFRNISAIFMTESYMRSSCDVFPIEFLDMKENSEVIFGKDALKELAIHPKHLRFQCEQELKSKIVNLKSAYLSNMRRRGLEELLFKSLNSTLHIMRNIIRLKGAVPPYAKESILKALSSELGLDATVPEIILLAKKNKRRLSPKEIEELLFDLAAFLERACDIVDRLE